MLTVLRDGRLAPRLPLLPIDESPTTVRFVNSRHSPNTFIFTRLNDDYHDNLAMLLLNIVLNLSVLISFSLV